MIETSDNPRDWTEERVLEDCRWEAFRGPGPGGQKRNKTSSAVRVTHVPSGISATAAESRSQAGNRRAALRRLRLRMALELRSVVTHEGFAAPAWFVEKLGLGRRLKVSPRDEAYWSVVGLVVDLLDASGGSVSQAAEMLGISTANLVDFLQRDEELLSFVNRMRAGQKLKALGGASARRRGRR
ncbi:MAG TPA: peptide chain release factor-like protein [Tepidisphaeraceae bacterium]|nr:peptide chain release factor-like protein [Tepidisphaeraceae bacterium]